MIWLVAIGAAVAGILAVAYLPALFAAPKEDVPQLQTGGLVTHALAVGEEGSFRGLAKGGKSPYQFEWTFPDGTIVQEMNATHAFSSPGQYKVMLDIRDSSGLSGHHSFDIDVAPAQ